MALFIEVRVDDALRQDAALVTQLVDICPVVIFLVAEGDLQIVVEYVD